MSKKDNIQKLYDQIEKKTKFIKEVAADLNKSPLTLRHHWFGNFWAIPADHEDRVIELLQAKIRQQNKVAV